MFIMYVYIVCSNKNVCVHLNLSNLRLLLPIPNCQHVIVTVVNNTQVLTRVLQRDRV